MPSVSVSVSPTQPVKCDNLKSHLMHSFMVARPVPVPVPAEVPSRSLRVGVPISISINLTKIPDRETKNYVPLMERMFPFMAPYTQNVNYLSVRLAACVWKGTTNRGEFLAPSRPGAWPEQARPVLIMLHVTLLMIIWMPPPSMPPRESCFMFSCSVARSFPDRRLTYHFPHFPFFEHTHRDSEAKLRPRDVKIFATNVLVPTCWKSPPAMFPLLSFLTLATRL